MTTKRVQRGTLTTETKPGMNGWKNLRSKAEYFVGAVGARDGFAIQVHFNESGGEGAEQLLVGVAGGAANIELDWTGGRAQLADGCAKTLVADQVGARRGADSDDHFAGGLAEAVELSVLESDMEGAKALVESVGMDIFFEGRNGGLVAIGVAYEELDGIVVDSIAAFIDSVNDELLPGVGVDFCMPLLDDGRVSDANVKVLEVLAAGDSQG